MICLTLSIVAKAQHYESGTSENYEEEALEQSFDYQTPEVNQVQFYQSHLKFGRQH